MPVNVPIWQNDFFHTELSAFPNHLFGPQIVADFAGKYKEKIGKPIEVLKHLWCNIFFQIQRYHQPLGPTANAAGHMAMRHRGVTSR
jgi:hypothetical protein